MKKNLLSILFSSLLIFVGDFASAQLTPACSPTYSSGSYSWNVSSFTINSIPTFTHSPSYSVHDYTAQSFTVTAGNTYSISAISNGYCGVATAADFNNDGDFDDPGELLTYPSYVATSPATYTFNITIPAAATSGPVRFRIFNRGANAGDGNPSGSACGSYGYGSWVDYTMNIINAVGCQPPSGLTVTNVLAASATISWSASASIPAPLGYIWKVVPSGSDPNITPGISGYTTALTASVNGLSALTAYQLFVKSNCGIDSSVWSLPATFNTPCSGTPSAGVAASSSSLVCSGVNFTLNLTGAASGTGISYQWQSTPLAANTWTNIAAATTINPSVNQTAATSYRVIVSCSGSGLTDTSNIVTVNMNAPSACYCIPTYSSGCSFGDLINNFILTGENGTDINNLNTGCSVNAYDDRTNDSVSLFIGSPYSGFISSNYSTDNARIWIDFNDNGTFESSESVAIINSVGTSNASFTITIPSTAASGNHRMRVRLVYSTPAASIDPCASSSYGETHDYTVNLLVPSGCISPSNIAATNFTNDAATISWTPSPLGDPYATFNYEVRTSGAAGSGGTGLSASGTAVVDTFANLTGLVAGTTYSVYVKTNCTGSTQSGWTTATLFTLPTYVPVVVSGFSADVIANGVGPALNSTTNDVDGVSFALVAQDFKASTTGASPTKYLPNGGSITSGSKWFQLANYSGNNSLRLQGASTSGTLHFLAPKQATSVYIMGISGSAVSTISAQVWFNDNTSQIFTGLSYPDWFATTGNIVVSQVGRINRTNNGLEAGAGPQLFENTLAISAANQSKQIDSIVFTNSASGVMNVLAVSIIPNYAQSCGLPSSLSASNITASSANIAWASNGSSTSYQVSYGAQGTTAASGTISTVTGTSTTLNTLTSNTAYQVFVRSVCTGSTYSDWIGPVNFQTPILPCTGTPTAGTLSSPVMNACPNTPAFPITSAGATSDLGITYSWRSSPAGLNTWTTLTSTGTSYSVSNQMVATDYQFIVSCTNSGLSDTASITITHSPYAELFVKFAF